VSGVSNILHVLKKKHSQVGDLRHVFLHLLIAVMGQVPDLPFENSEAFASLIYRTYVVNASGAKTWYIAARKSGLYQLLAGVVLSNHVTVLLQPN
jgi:hypothetical protein